MRFLLPFIFFLLSACGGGPVAPEWQSNASSSLGLYQQRYLRGDSTGAEVEFRLARAELASTGSAALVARAELIRCATRAASLEFDICPGFEKLRADAGAEELAYADYLAGRVDRAAGEGALSKLVSAGVKLKSSKITSSEIAVAIEIAAAQGWRRPLLAWLDVEVKRAEAAGDRDAAARLRRRIKLIADAP